MYYLRFICDKVPSSYTPTGFDKFPCTVQLNPNLRVLYTGEISMWISNIWKTENRTCMVFLSMGHFGQHQLWLCTSSFLLRGRNDGAKIALNMLMSCRRGGNVNVDSLAFLKWLTLWNAGWHLPCVLQHCWAHLSLQCEKSLGCWGKLNLAPAFITEFYQECKL